MKNITLSICILLSSVFIFGNEAFCQIIKSKQKWDAGQTLNILLMNGGEEEKRLFRRAVSLWAPYVNLNFEFYEIEEERFFLPLKFRKDTIRVQFNRSENKNYSEVGTNFNLGLEKISYMNIAKHPAKKYDFLGTAIHEFGHALGLIHEHQHPEAMKGITKKEMNDLCKYQYFIDVTDEYELGRCLYNIGSYTYEDLIEKQYGYTEYDIDSIMHYEWIGEETHSFFTDSLSLGDKNFIANQYPFEQKLTENQIVQMDEDDRDSEAKWLVNEFQHPTCNVVFEGNDIFLTKITPTKTIKAKVKSISMLETYFGSCTRSFERSK